MTKLMWRSRDARTSVTQNKIIPHNEFLKRIRKTLYCSSVLTEVQTISRPLADYAAEIFSENHKGYSLNRLNRVTVGKLNTTPCSLILAMIYLDRLNDVDPMYSRRITPTELFLVSMMVSTKFYSGYDEDIMYANEWAEQGNMSSEHLKKLELEFLSALNWNIYVSSEDFFEKLKSIEIILAKRQGLQRGWLTYTELTNLLPSMAIANSFLQYSALFIVSYAASVVTIAGAFFLASQVPGTALYNCSKSATSRVDISTNRTAMSPATTNTQNDLNDTLLDEETENRCVNLEQQFDRLHEEIIDDVSIPVINNKTITSTVVTINIPKINFLQNIGIKTGINLRNFLEDDGDTPNASNYNELAYHLIKDQLCRSKYESYMVWMKLL